MLKRREPQVQALARIKKIRSYSLHVRCPWPSQPTPSLTRPAPPSYNTLPSPTAPDFPILSSPIFSLPILHLVPSLISSLLAFYASHIPTLILVGSPDPPYPLPQTYMPLVESGRLSVGAAWASIYSNLANLWRDPLVNGSF